MTRSRLIFDGLDSSGWLLACLAAVVAALVLIVVLLRYERRLVPSGVGNTLLALRLLVLALVLLVLMQPGLVWELDREHTGRILVAIDLSESMDTRDTHATRAEKLRWARALGMIGGEADARLDRWIAEFEAGREPDFVAADEVADPDRRRQLAELRREHVEGLCDEIDQVSRKEMALRLLTSTNTSLLPELEKLANVDLAVFAGRSDSAEAETLARLLENPPTTLDRGRSDLAQPLSTGSAGSDAAELIGVVLLTDGRDNARRNVLGAARRTALTGGLVVPVIFGSPHRPKDLAISSLDYPQTAFKDDTPVVTATFTTAGFEGRPLEIELVSEDQAAETQTKTIVPDGPLTTVDFDLDAGEIGRRSYTVRTEPLEGETRDDNNQKTFAINVVDDQAQVVLIEGEARWEFRFLDNALSRDERVEIEKVVFRQPYMGVLPGTFFPRRLSPPADPDDPADSPVAEADLVIVGDVSPEEVTDASWQLLEQFVVEGGGTLVLVAGRHFLPQAHPSEALARLLPVTTVRTVDMNAADQIGAPTERGFRLELTPDGEREAMLRFDTDPDINAEIWSGLPGHTWGLLGTTKPGATVFAYARRPGEAASLEAERQNAIIVRQHYGFGQVLWIGIDSTWRWRHRVGDAYHHRFWGQLGRWAAENKAAAGNDYVKFGPEHTDVELGDDAVVRARWTQPFLRRYPNLKARAEIYRVDAAGRLSVSAGGAGRRAAGDAPRPFSTLDLEPVEGRPLIHEARAVSLPAGDYRVKLVVEEADLGPEELFAPLYVHHRQTLELADLSSHPDLLQQVADAGHPAGQGRLFHPDEIDGIPALFRNPHSQTTERQEKDLWDTWLMLALFFALMTAEWVTRKLNGLP